MAWKAKYKIEEGKQESIPQFSHLVHLSPQKSYLMSSFQVHFSLLFVQVAGLHK